jgi:hypothetical protein
LLLVVCQIELLAIFSPLAPYWQPNRVYRLKLVFAAVQLFATLPSYGYPALFHILMNSSRSLFNFFMIVIRVN